MNDYVGKFSNYTYEDFYQYAKENYKYRETRLLFGHGINDAGYMVQIEDREWFAKTGKRVVVWRCPVYQHWMAMIRRVFSEKEKIKSPFLDSHICDEWLVFSNFKKWFVVEDSKFKECDYPLCIDKDLKVLGNKLYSSANCLILPKDMNSKISIKGGGEYPLGVSWKKKNGMYQSQVLSEGYKRYLGLHSCAASAHNAWLRYKVKILRNMYIPQGMEDYLRPYTENMADFLIYCEKESLQLYHGSLSEFYHLYQKHTEQLDTLYKFKNFGG